MRIALFEPDIPQNTGNIFRLGACLGIEIDIIEPTGYVFDDKRFRRSSMDYIKYIKYKRHLDWDNFFNWSENGYDLEIGGSKRKSIVNWIIKGDENYSSLRVRINPDLLYKNRLIKWLVWNLYIKFMIQSYINHVVRGFKFFIDTGNKVHSNQFGKHKWFS